MLPHFLVIGAEKGGTTWLHDVLRHHPDLYLPDVKEVHFFNRFDSNGREIDNFRGRGLAWYERHFEAARPGQLAGEATPMYLCDPEAPARIAETLPDARFIVMLREPVSRALSHYRMARSKKHTNSDLGTLIRDEDARFLGRGLYARQLERWFALFPRDRFLILFFDDVAARPQELLRRVADWLGLDPAPLLAARPEERRNAATGYRSAALHNTSVRIARGLRNFPVTRGLAGALKSRGLYNAVRRANTSAPPRLELPEADRRAVEAYYREDLAALAALLEGETPTWARSP